MYMWVIVSVLFILLIIQEIFFLREIKDEDCREKKELTEEYTSLRKEEESSKSEMKNMEVNLSKHFLFYELARKLAPFLNKEDLFGVFSEEIKRLGRIEDIEFSGSAKNKGYLKFDLARGCPESLYLKTQSKEVISNAPYFMNLLNLCLERIKLYDELQRLSIGDSLTKVYNRRYFTLRFIEEFERAKKFRLNLSFLMIDIDHFKKVNDTYGHLVGDVVLREAARLIKESIREIDLAARYGGEEFSVILPETDKAGAIMAAERINLKISQERIKAFDETLSVSVSVGVASFPQNAAHSDVLIETADKALYKAKLSGRNRTCWF